MIEIRRATAGEADKLTSLAHAAKAHWNYPREWIDSWHSDLTLTPEFITANEVFVAIVDNVIAGCCALAITEQLVDPEQMGKGIGRALFEHATQRAGDLGFSELELSADPNAEAFYARMGATRIGAIPADMFGHARVLPRMRVH